MRERVKVRVCKKRSDDSSVFYVSIAYISVISCSSLRLSQKEIGEKYFAPTREFPEAWDVALLAVYRADIGVKDVLKGRSLLAKAKRMVGSRNGLGVLSGDSDSVVPLRASERVAELLDVKLETITECGHLPMDEKPMEFAQSLIKFIL